MVNSLPLIMSLASFRVCSGIFIPPISRETTRQVPSNRAYSLSSGSFLTSSAASDKAAATSSSADFLMVNSKEKWLNDLPSKGITSSSVPSSAETSLSSICYADSRHYPTGPEDGVHKEKLL